VIAVIAIAVRVVRERRGPSRCARAASVTKTPTVVAIGMPNASAATASVKVKK
jgi:hypothetical protein